MRLNSPQINIISKACMKASKSLIRDFGEIENLQVSSKGPGDFVTSADKRTEKIIIEELQKLILITVLLQKNLELLIKQIKIIDGLLTL